MNDLTLLFDLDGTLINSLPDICGALNHVRGEWGLKPRPTEELKRCIGHGAMELIRTGIPEITDHEAALARYRQLYLERPDWGGHAYAGVAETLLPLRRRPEVRLGVVTNKTTASAELALKYYLPELKFDVVFGPERVRAQKPSPLHIEDALAALGRKPDSAWFVGDNPVDLACAEAAGVRFLGAGYGFGGVQAPAGRQLGAFSEILSHLAPFLV